MIEFALVAPLLLLILFSIFDVGRALNYQNDETNLANVAARYVSVVNQPVCSCTSATTGCTSGSNAPNLYAYIQCVAQSDSASLGTAVGVCINDEAPSPNGGRGSAGAYDAGDPVKITVLYPYNFLSWVGKVAGHPTVQLSSSATMMMEASGNGDTWISNTNTAAGNPSNSSTSGTPLCSTVS